MSIQGGEPEKISTRVVGSRSPAISPAGDQIAVRIYDEKLNKWQVEILQLDGEQTWSVVDIGGYIFQWSPDGKALALNLRDVDWDVVILKNFH